MKGLQRRLGRFSLVGLMGAAVQLVLLSVLTKCFRVLGVVATPVAVEITILHNFIWHQRFTWRDRGANGFRQVALRLWRFHAGNGLISLCGNTLLMYCLADRLRAPAVPSAMAAIGVCSLVNFLLADRWVYANTSRCGASPGASATDLRREWFRNQ